MGRARKIWLEVGNVRKGGKCLKGREVRKSLIIVGKDEKMWEEVGKYGKG